MRIRNWNRSAQECLEIISQSDHNAFTHVNKLSLKNYGKLKNLPIAIKANICTADLPTTCASASLIDFIPEEDAVVVRRLSQEGAFVIGKTNMDEFGMGSSSVFSFHGPVKNPVYTNEQRVAGGSSGGSAAAVAMGSCFAAIGSDTGGSVRLPASYCQVVGFKPSYGAIPRTGLVAYASSLDTVGILANEVDHVRIIFGN
jgi:aspartyl-tRNA(Asn)/glutamyl-tRNA(Gln) amidotransferase subunit A